MLDDQGRDYLRRIRAAAQRMAQLIDDLLGLSHVSRFELHRESVSVSALAARIIRELQRSTPDRRVDIAIESDITLDADPALLRILLENLIGNAWKFTSRRDNARITVSSVTVGGYPGLQITDNGRVLIPPTQTRSSGRSSVRTRSPTSLAPASASRLFSALSPGTTGGSPPTANSGKVPLSR